ncbi:unnamed protein product [Lasius platythorax]|uniref:Uncharacterized protein n=1 Tax=Lasius platythorax TaxID=488582 RepID=A0AAV2NY29_9HYME
MVLSRTLARAARSGKQPSELIPTPLLNVSHINRIKAITPAKLRNISTKICPSSLHKLRGTELLTNSSRGIDLDIPRTEFNDGKAASRKSNSFDTSIANYS